MANPKEGVTRREFFKKASVFLGAVATLKVPEASRTRETIIPEIPVWPEVDGFVEAGAKLLGTLTEETVRIDRYYQGTSDGNFVPLEERKETMMAVRAYQLPDNPDFPGSIPVLVCARDYPIGADGKDAYLDPFNGVMNVVFVPKDSLGNKFAGKTHDRTWEFGEVCIGADFEEGYPGLKSAQYYIGGERLTAYELGTQMTVEKQTFVAENTQGFIPVLNREPYYVVTDKGVVAVENGTSINIDNQYGYESSILIPKGVTITRKKPVTITWNSYLGVVKGLSAEPFSVLGRPVRMSGKTYQIEAIGAKPGVLRLVSTDMVLGTTFRDEMELKLGEDRMIALGETGRAISEFWQSEKPGSREVRIQRVWNHNPVEKIRDLSVLQPEYQHSLVINSPNGLRAEITIGVEPIPETPERIDPGLDA